MLQVKNIKKRSYPISQKTRELCKTLNVENYLPKITPQDVSFELHNTTTEMANALRRCINSEIEVLVMDFKDDDFISDDSFIILHELKKRINLIPIRQISGIKHHIDVYNDTDVIIPVYSKDIKEGTNKKDFKDSKEQLFSHTFIITYLRPGKRLVINNIHIKKGVSYKNGTMFSFPGKVGYSCIELEEDEKNGKEIKSSMECEPTTYRITIPRQKFIDPIQIIKLAVKTLGEKISSIERLIETNKENYYSSEMEIIYTKNKGVYKIYNETYTIGNLLVRYGMNIDKTIKNIHCIKKHPSFDYILVELEHAEPRNIMLNAISTIKKELKNINDAF